MVDGIFLVSSVLNARNLSIYTPEQRFEQTKKTLESIDKYCASNQKYVLDVSPEIPEQWMMEELSQLGSTVIYMGIDSISTELSRRGMKSLGEISCMINSLNYLKMQELNCKRIYKLSGRYVLNDNFILENPEYENKFVFAKALDSWMPKARQEITGASKLLRTRLWHMDRNLLEIYHERLHHIFQDCANFGIDIEHSYYKNLHDLDILELDTIGVEGAIAPTGEYVIE